MDGRVEGSGAEVAGAAVLWIRCPRALYTPKELVSIESRMRVQRAMNEVVSSFPMKIDQDNFRKLKQDRGSRGDDDATPSACSPDLEDKVALRETPRAGLAS